MKDTQISSPELLEAALVNHRLDKREDLWRTAAGYSYKSTDIVMMIVGLLSLIYGLYVLLSQNDISAVTLVVMGGGLIGASFFRHQQSQIQALRDLLKEAKLSDP